MHFHEPFALLLLPLVPLLAWGLVFRARRRNAAVRYAPVALFGGIEPGFVARFSWLPDALMLAALAAVVVGLARPQMPDKDAPSFTEGIDIVLALDVSTSMNARDFQPDDRMGVAKQVVAEFIGKRVADRLGLVVFAGEAYTQCPLTLDHGVLLNVLNEVRTGVITDGTAIGNAMGVSLNRLRESKAKSRVVILVTDGENNKGNITPDKAAEYAAELGVKVFTIQVGQGGRVPFPTGYKDLLGREVIEEVEIPVNPELLKRIAQTTGAEYFVATDSASLRGSLLRILDKLERSKIEEAPLAERNIELAGFPLAAGVAFLALAMMLSWTRFRRL